MKTTLFIFLVVFLALFFILESIGGIEDLNSLVAMAIAGIVAVYYRAETKHKH